MRKPVSIFHERLKAAKLQARRRGLTLGQILEAALRRELLSTGAEAAPPAVPVFRGGTGLRPGIELNSNRSLQETLDDGLDLNQLR